jgi:RNA polymerase sigma-70 factor (ECF subfamily)
LTTEREIDQKIVERIQAGDTKAFELLVTKYQRKLMRLVSRLVRDSAEAEDVVQEAFIKAYRALPQFRGDSAFYTWLYRIGINTAKNYLVTMGRRAPTSTDADVEEAETFDDGDYLRDINTPESMLATKQIAETVNLAYCDYLTGNRGTDLRRDCRSHEVPDWNGAQQDFQGEGGNCREITAAVGDG